MQFSGTCERCGATITSAISKKSWHYELELHERKCSVFRTLEQVKMAHVIKVIDATETLEDAAVCLGINLSTLWRMRKKYGLDRATG